MVTRLADGTLFVGEVVEETKDAQPAIETITEEIAEIPEERPATEQRKGGRPPKRK